MSCNADDDDWVAGIRPFLFLFFSLLPLFPCADTTASAGASANTGEMLCHRNFDSPVTEPQRPLLQKQAEGGGTKLKLQAPTTRGVPKQAHLSNSSRMARVADATARLPRHKIAVRVGRQQPGWARLRTLISFFLSSFFLSFILSLSFS